MQTRKVEGGKVTCPRQEAGEMQVGGDLRGTLALNVGSFHYVNLALPTLPPNPVPQDETRPEEEGRTHGEELGVPAGFSAVISDTGWGTTVHCYVPDPACSITAMDYLGTINGLVGGHVTQQSQSESFPGSDSLTQRERPSSLLRDWRLSPKPWGPRASPLGWFTLSRGENTGWEPRICSSML